MSSVAVELPHEAGVRGEGFGGCEGDGVVGSPVASCAAEGGEAGGGGESGTAEGEDAGGGLEVFCEGVEVGLGDGAVVGIWVWGGGGGHGDRGEGTRRLEIAELI